MVTCHYITSGERVVPSGLSSLGRWKPLGLNPPTRPCIHNKMRVLIPTPLRQYAERRTTVELSAATVAEALASLTAQHPDLRRQLFTDDGRLRSFVNVYVNDEDIRYLQRENTRVSDSDTIAIVPSVAGGRL